MILPEIALATFTGKKDNQPQPLTMLCADLFNLLTQHQPRESKDGSLFSPTVYKPGVTRSIEGVDCVTCFVADIDDGTSPLFLQGRWLGLAHCLYSSYSSTAIKPKWRVVFPLAVPVPAAEWKRTWAKLNAALMDGHCDPACRDCSHI